MAAVVRIKNNRFARINLQNKDARYFSFGEIAKPGVLHGYIKGVVQTAHPLFDHSYYGKMRKIILAETRDDGDDDDECLEFSIFTRGTVAEKCAEIKEGDFLLLENPFFELSHPQKPNLQITGDKRCSDICIWDINNKSRLLVGQEENGGERNIETSVSTTDQEHDCNDEMEVSISDGDVPLSMDQANAANLAKSPRTTSSDDVAKPKRLPRGSAIKKNGPSQSSRLPKSSVIKKTAKTDSSSGTTDVAKSPRLTRRSALKKNGSSQSSRLTRSTSARGNKTSSKESSQENKDSSASQSERPLTRSAAGKTTDRDTVSSPPRKRKRKFQLGPKGSSSSPSNSPELRNVVALEDQPRKSPRKKNTPQLQTSNIKTAKKSLPLKTTDEIGGPSKGSPSSLEPPKSTISMESSQENEDKEAGELQMNSQASTPSGTFSTKKQKCFGQSDSNPEYFHHLALLSSALWIFLKNEITRDEVEFAGIVIKSFCRLMKEYYGIPRKNLQLKSEKALNATPTKTTKSQGIVAAGSPAKVNKDTRNSTQPKTAETASVTFVDDDKVPKKSSSLSSHSNEQGKGAKQVVDKSGKPTKDRDAIVAQPSVSDQSTVSNVNAPSTTSSNAQPISTASSIVPSTSTTLTDAPSISTSSSNAPTTSTSSNVLPQSTSYTVPPPYTKICDVKLNTMCDLYGVAKFFKPPWKSRGTDMCSVVVLADPSSDEPLECVMFKDVILLPQVRRVGDIVRLHRMNIKKYKDKLQAVSTRGFSALVFDGNLNSPVTKEAARVTTGSFSFNESEKKVVQALKEWHFSRPDLFEEANFLTVSTVEPDVYFDIICKVKGMAKHTNIDCFVLRVTDGTQPKYDIKSCVDDDSYEEVLAVDSTNQSPVFDVFLYGEHSSLVTTLDVKAGTILLLHNVHSIATQGGPGASLLDVLEPTLELCIHRGSEYGRGMAVLSPDSDDAMQLLQKLKQQGQTSPTKQT